MSWQTYVDSNLMGTGVFSDAAILGQAGGSWATSKGFEVSDEERIALMKGFEDEATIQASGVHLAGVKYLTIQSGVRSIYGKKGGAGCICVKTKQAIIVATYPAGTQPGDAALRVEKLADYLISVEF